MPESYFLIRACVYRHFCFDLISNVKFQQIAHRHKNIAWHHFIIKAVPINALHLSILLMNDCAIKDSVCQRPRE